MPRQPDQGPNHGLVQEGRHEGLVAPDDQSPESIGPLPRRRAQQPSGMSGDGLDEGVGLIATSAGETLLGPAAGRRARLDIAGPALVGEEVAAAGEANRVAAAPDEDESERVEDEAFTSRDHPVPAAHHDATAEGVVDPVDDPLVAASEVLDPALEALGRDLDHAIRD